MKSYHRHQKQTRNRSKKAKNRKQNAERNKKNTNQKVAPTDKLKHLKTKQQKATNANATNANDTIPENNGDEFVNMNGLNATLSIKEMDELNDYIHEYLIFHGYDKTIYEFEKERISNSYTQIKIEHNLMNPNIMNDDAMRNEILNKIITMFDANDIDGIFKIWNRYLSTETLNNDAYAIKLECHLNIYKFIIHQNIDNKKNLNHIRSELQSYFNENGQRLALCQDVLPYFSLPYIDNAYTHPIFSKFFQPQFPHNLRSQLTGFMLKSLDSITVPKLHSIFAISQKVNIKDLLPNNNKNVLNDNNNNIDYLTQILRVTSDFVNKMQYCFNHSLPPSTAMIGECKQKMSKIAADILETRNISKQIQVTDSNGDVPAVQYDNDNQRALLTTIRNSVNSNEINQINQINQQQQQPKEFNFGTITITNNMKPLQTTKTTVYLNINYNKIKQQISIIKDASTADQTKLLLLLQSLRWRVTKLVRHNEKRSIVVEYIRNDIFQCNDIKIVSNLLKHRNKQIIETGLRLLNVVSSFAIGRTYLLKLDHDKLINILSAILTRTNNDDSIRMNSLGCLQKLSLRRELQDTMIEKGLIGWIIEMLNDELNYLSEYTVEYSTALLMNLTLRTKGKKQCQLNEQHINKILNTLLKLLNSSFVAQIHTYVNGVLYSLLSEKSIHEMAIKIDLIQKLNKCVDKYNEASFKQQIDYIISQLSSKTSLDLINLESNDDNNNNDEDSDEASNEDYSENEDYEEYDVNELTEYLKEEKEDNNDYVQGDQFLFEEYQQNGDQSKLNVQPLQKRPITPQLTKQITKNDKNVRIPKFTSPSNTDKNKDSDSNIATPRNDKWMVDNDYREVFGSKKEVARTPPYGAMAKKTKQ